MATLKPFRGLRPPREDVQQISAPPYDVVNREEAKAYAGNNEKCFFRISRPEIELGSEIDEHAPGVYSLGATNLQKFIKAGWLRSDAEPRFYLYRQRMGARTQLGLVAAASVDEYDRGIIKKHEHTRPDKEDDRTHHIEKLGANDEPVFLTFRQNPDIDALFAEGSRAAPEYDFTSDDGVAHSFWVVPHQLNESLEAAFARVPTLYIADGHHRSAAASRVRRHFRDLGKTEGHHDRFLAVVFPHNQMHILDYNRLVKDLHGLSPDTFLERLRQDFIVEPASDPKPPRLHQFGVYLQRKWHRLTAESEVIPQTPVGVLDVSILQERVLGPVLGIGDPRTDPRIAFVGGIRGTQELERRVNSGEHAVAFSMYPTSLEQLMAIADAGQVMPPKSTWFEPKLRSGLVLHLF